MQNSRGAPDNSGDHFWILEPLTYALFQLSGEFFGDSIGIIQCIVKTAGGQPLLHNTGAFSGGFTQRALVHVKIVQTTSFQTLFQTC